MMYVDEQNEMKPEHFGPIACWLKDEMSDRFDIMGEKTEDRGVAHHRLLSWRIVHHFFVTDFYHRRMSVPRSFGSVMQSQVFALRTDSGSVSPRFVCPSVPRVDFRVWQPASAAQCKSSLRTDTLEVRL